MLSAVFTAIYNKFNTGNSFDLAVGNRFYPYKVPNNIAKNMTYPYSVYWEVTDAPEYTFNTEMNNMLLQIDIFDNSSSSLTLLDAQQKLWTLFDDTTLTITGYNHLLMERNNHRLLLEEEPRVWHSMTEYNILVQKQ